MATRADTIRDRRQGWAVPGGSHDRLIRVVRVALPLAVVVLGLFLAAVPLTSQRDISFVLSKDRVEIAHERMRLSRAVYRGQDAKGQPFNLTAASAVQQTSADPVVKMQTLRARLAQPNGEALAVAPQGRYDMNSEKIAIDGPVRLSDSTGYRLDTRNVDIDLKTRQFASRTPVSGLSPTGRFTADRMTGDLNSHVVVLEGRARLHIVQGQSKAAK
ncbi:LPS export ABC transporter periplasmic protein LptC [Sphingomonas naphthae]|uniref:LPS export ABC transporter periplasmic protein LptC n=1 Tax=Sphingomonas naphthae TaxID=1813468 RepID=A0ABY7TR97_9SPHN|nr:LPS export ABC transporter periplasmic protein LptC [Sphingomonas naphthae]WCT74905.1 LPS export ABC transporter periplasmic protein LptC [Sphingomonas naphthae]